MRNAIVLAPHPDDELIGCFHVLIKTVAEVFILDVESESRELRMAEAEKLAGTLTYDIDFLSLEMLRRCLKSRPKDTIIYAPDPTFETHPDHKLMGSVGAEMLRNHKREVIFYSINMQAPYIYALPSDVATQKKNRLEEFYPSQKDLWVTDARYYLFEGYCKWLDPTLV